MSLERSDTLVLFGATGDLAHKKIFPALYAMVAKGTLTEPVIGVAFDAWDLQQLQARARDGIVKATGKVDEKSSRNSPRCFAMSAATTVALRHSRS